MFENKIIFDDKIKILKSSTVQIKFLSQSISFLWKTSAITSVFTYLFSLLFNLMW